MSLSYNSFYYPLGKGNAAINFDTKITDLKSKYFKTILKDILVSCVYNSSKDTYTFFFKIPSEENDKYPTSLMYDTILEFVPPKGGEKSAKAGGNLKPYDINIFSNSPGFVFTFDYVIKHKYNAFPKCLPFKYLSLVAITKSPEVKNLYQIMTIEKTTWWSLFHLDYNGYLNKDNIKIIESKESINFFLNKMSTQPEKLKEINALKTVMNEEKIKKLSEKNKKDAEKVYNSTEKTRSSNRDPLAYSMQVSNTKKKSFDKLLLSNPLMKNVLKAKDAMKEKGFLSFNKLKK